MRISRAINVFEHENETKKRENEKLFNIYLKVWSCFSLRTVLTRVGLPSDGPEGPLPRMLLCEPDSLPESVSKIITIMIMTEKRP